ncbi:MULTISPECIES: lysophospholipid acyltransferase family protein [unclassified Acinetobacter]|uniref:lysophospholipid acyltransferase family protein n=1 Tax=unclassified Acinetobacter TaxID=196816 RepID=UPI002578308A|nr:MULTISPECIES: lysophospholipid acyltransferase family protein [unclassified Acinetobacter]MDM1764974.1 lysophospholipid acyltransferase family protein [Acinetobacter sp. 226-1]MDM1768401.1 lysophospholipid acyltransferase family protein [Acinetobacter sp. 226-4]
MYFILKIIALLPLSFLQLLASWVAWWLNLINSSMKRITAINLKIAYPDLTQKQHNDLVKRSLKSQCMTYLEFIKCWGSTPTYSLNLLSEIYGEQHYLDALNNKKGIIIVVPHFGCWELLNAWLNLYTAPVIMYKPNKNKGINRYLIEARQKANATLAPTDESGIRAIFKHLKQGGLTVILPDHVPKPSGGIFSDFYGQHALSSTLVSKLASKTQCNVLGLSCIRNEQQPQKYSVHCQPIANEILSKDLQLSVDTLNTEMERMINQAPEQYIWSYKRFRRLSNQCNIYQKSH